MAPLLVVAASVAPLGSRLHAQGAPRSAGIHVELLPDGAIVERSPAADPKPAALVTQVAAGRGAFGRGTLWMATAGGVVTLLRVVPADEAWQLGVGVRSGVASLLDLATRSSELLTSDFYVALPFTLRRGAWSATIAPWHESSHLGDEYAERTRTIARAVSHDQVVLRAGGARRLHAVEASAYVGAHALTYHWGQQADNVSGDRVLFGAELRSVSGQAPGLSMRPMLAIDQQHLRGWGWARSTTAVAGIELTREPARDGSALEAARVQPATAGRAARLRLFVSAHDGAAPWWQFGEQRMRWLGAGVQWEP